MSIKIINNETLLETRRNKTVNEQIPFEVCNEILYVAKKIVNGEMETIELDKPIGEMLTLGSVSNMKEFMRKVTLDVELGKEQVQLLYQSIYDTISDPNMPKILDAKWALYGACVFLEHLEGQEIKFGSLDAEKGVTAKIQTYTSGFMYTKEMIDFNEMFSIEILNKAMGEAWNALLNHIHLFPIISFKYVAKNITNFISKSGVPYWLNLYETFKQVKKDASNAKRMGNILLINPVDREDILMALRGGHQLEGSIYPPIDGFSTLIEYEGYEMKVGKEEYKYQGVNPGESYLIRPKRGFKELIRKDLTIETGNKDVSRLIEEQIVGYAYRGVFAAVEENVQKIILR